jgi:hypothetical protein
VFKKTNLYFRQFVFSGDNTKVYFRVTKNTKVYFRIFVFSGDNTKVYFQVNINTNLYFRVDNNTYLYSRVIIIQICILG